MPGSLVRLRLLGIDVAVQPSFVFTAVLFGAVGGGSSFGDIATWVAIVFVSVLWHELGHALAGRAFGCTPRIELNGGGGLTFDANVDVWWKEVLVCLAGPFAGFALGGLMWGIGQRGLPMSAGEVAVIKLAIYVNVGWGALNLFPVFPYDGGQAFRAVALRWIPQGLRVAVVLSFVVATLGVVYALTQKRFWLAYLAGRGMTLAFQEIQQIRAQRRLEGSWQAWRDAKPERCEELARTAMSLDPRPNVRAPAIERIAWARLARGMWREARKCVVEELPEGQRCSAVLDVTLLLLEERVTAAVVRANDLTPDAFALWPSMVTGWLPLPALELTELVSRLVVPEIAGSLPREPMLAIAHALFLAGKLEESAVVSSAMFEAHADPTDAYNVACSASRLGHVDHALYWLDKAVKAGWIDGAALEEDTDLAAVREAPGFNEVVARCAPVT